MNQNPLGSEKHGPLKHGRPTKEQQKTILRILKSYWDGESKTCEEIAQETGYNRKTVNRYFREFSEAATTKIDKEFIERCRKRMTRELKINGQR